MARKYRRSEIKPYAQSLLKALVAHAAEQRSSKVWIPAMIQFSNAAYQKDGLSEPSRALHHDALGMLEREGYVQEGRRSGECRILRSAWVEMPENDKVKALIQLLEPRRFGSVLDQTPVGQREDLERALIATLDQIRERE